MISRKTLSGILLSVALSSCAAPEYTPAATDMARIRVFHGTSVYLYLDGHCSKDSNQRIHAAAGGHSYFVPNKRIGMPPTADMPFSYHEYAIPADRPVGISMYWAADDKKTGTRFRCGPVMRYFSPKAGHDYDTRIEFLKQGGCEVHLRELAMTDSGIATARALPYESIPVDLKCLEDE